MRSGPAVLLLCCLLAACGSAPRRDLEFDRLHASLQALSTDPEFARLALAERALAETAVRRLDASSINADEHAHLAYLAERRVDIAYIAAQTEQERAHLAELEREHASLQLAASRRENAAMREELERQRQRELVQQEVQQRGLGQGTAALSGGSVAAERSGAGAMVPGVAGGVPSPAASVEAPSAGAAASLPAASGAAGAGGAALRPASAISAPAVSAASMPAASSAATPPASGTAAPPASGAAIPAPLAPAVSPDAAVPAVSAAASAARDLAPPAPPESGGSGARNASGSAVPALDQASAVVAPPPAAVPGSAQPGSAQPVVSVPSASGPGEIPLAGRLARLAPEAGAEGEQLTLEDLIFEPGTAQLVAEAGVGIARVAAFVNGQPARAIRIEGHTDATGSPDANRALSLRRAEAVRDALIASGVAAQRIEVSGEGSARPVASNDEAEGRARNRRVVVVLRPWVG